MVESRPNNGRYGNREKETYDPSPSSYIKFVESMGVRYLKEEDVDGEGPEGVDSDWYNALVEIEELVDEHSELSLDKIDLI
jgi:hypothetical protein